MDSPSLRRKGGWQGLECYGDGEWHVKGKTGISRRSWECWVFSIWSTVCRQAWGPISWAETSEPSHWSFHKFCCCCPSSYTRLLNPGYWIQWKIEINNGAGRLPCDWVKIPTASPSLSLNKKKRICGSRIQETNTFAVAFRSNLCASAWPCFL